MNVHHLALAAFLLAPLLSAQDTLLKEARHMVPLYSPAYSFVPAAAGDVDGDTRVDVVVGTKSQAVIWRGTAAGRFVEHASAISTQEPSGVALLDVEGDGDLDLFLTENFSLTPHALYANDGAGTFVESAGIPMIGGAEATVAGDFDGDGDSDLIIGGQCKAFLFCDDDREDRLWRNDGAGTFSEQPLGAQGYSTKLVTVDLDLDGDLDLLRGSTTYFNDGSGAFASGQVLVGNPSLVPPVVLDRDEDGDPDVLLASNHPDNPPFLHDNDGTGAMTWLGAGAFPHVDGVTLAAFDFSGDGYADVVAGDSGGQRLFRNDQAGGWIDAGLLETEGDFYTTLAVDAEKDGDEDLVMVGPYGPAFLLGGGGSAVDVSRPMPWLSNSASGTVFLDVDSDGDLDLLNGHRVFRNEGAGQLGEQVPAGDYTASTFAGTTADLLAHDFDGDGDQDLLDGSVLQDSRIYRNDGGTFQEGFVFPNRLASGLAADDFDGDGSADALFGFEYQPAELYRGIAGGAFAAVAVPAFTFEDTADLAVADFDGNGSPDVYFTQQTLDLLYLNQAGAFVAGSALPASTATRSTAVAAGDVDLDGDVDVAVACEPFLSLSGQNLLLLNQGGGAFVDATAAFPAAHDETRDVLLADLDIDGLLDVLFLNDDEPSRFYRNVGGGAFVDASARIPSRVARMLGIAAGDLDGDQDPDVIVSPQGPLEVWTNHRRQIAWGAVPRIGYTIPVELSGSPSAPWWVAWSPSRVTLPFPPLGTLFLDPASTHIIAFGLLGAGGAATLPVPIPDAPVLVDVEVYVQALIGNPVYLANLEVVRFGDL